MQLKRYILLPLMCKILRIQKKIRHIPCPGVQAYTGRQNGKHTCKVTTAIKHCVRGVLRECRRLTHFFHPSLSFEGKTPPSMETYPFIIPPPRICPSNPPSYVFNLSFPTDSLSVGFRLARASLTWRISPPSLLHHSRALPCPSSLLLNSWITVSTLIYSFSTPISTSAHYSHAPVSTITQKLLLFFNWTYWLVKLLKF